MIEDEKWIAALAVIVLVVAVAGLFCFLGLLFNGWFGE